MSRNAKDVYKKEDIDFLLSLNKENMKSSLFYEMFGDFGHGPRFNPFDTVIIPAKSYGRKGKMNIEPIHTTVGLWVFNKYFIEEDLLDEIGYFNSTINKKTMGKLNDRLSYALLENRITLDVLKRFINKCQKFMPMVSILSPSTTLKMLLCSQTISKKKEELYKTKYKEGIDKQDPIAAEALSNELLDYARSYLKDDESMDMFNSGASGQFDNNFKNMYVMKGAVKDPDPLKGYNIIMSNYVDGISKEEYSDFAKSLAAGPYARAKKTEDGGYWEKLFLPAYSDVILDKPGSDCGTKRTIKITITEDNIDSVMYNYIVEGNKLVEITSLNRDKYIGKTVRMRFSSMCENEKLCNKCAGNLFYRIGIYNVGTAVPQIASILKNICMKNFHDSTVRSSEMDPMKAFSIDE